MPRSSTDNRRPLILLACSVIVIALILLILFNVDRSPPGDTPVAARRQIDTQDSALDPAVPPAASRGWIQIAGPDGQLKQQYRCAHLDPAPEGLGPGWIKMDQPQLELFMSDGGVVTMDGVNAEMFAPNSALESGTIEGDVIIRLYDDVAHLEAGNTNAANVELRTTLATFDNRLGAINCPGAIHIQTRQGEFRGHELRLFIDQANGVINGLHIASLDELRLTGAGTGTETETGTVAVADTGTDTGTGTGTDTDTDSGTGTDTDTDTVADAGTGARPGTDRVMRPERVFPSAKSAIDPDPENLYYRMTLSDDVRIVRGRGPDALRLSGDQLHIDFSLESSDGGLLSEPTTGAGVPLSPSEFMLAVALAADPTPPAIPALRTIAPAPSDDDIVITCTGPLSMRPVKAKRRLPSPQHRRVTLEGSPVRIDDPLRDATATAASMAYLAPDGRIDLRGTPEFPLHIESPEVTLDGEHLTLSQTLGTGLLRGPGTLRFLRVDEDPGLTGPRRFRPREERLRITWQSRVGLTFEPTSDADPTDLAALESATFIEAVELHSAEAGVRVGGGGGGLDLLGERTSPTVLAGRADPGHLSANEMTIVFAPSSNGERLPSHLLASGSVKVTGRARTLWTPELEINFASPTPGSTEPEVREVIARDGVQFLLEGGQRVIGGTLNIDVPGELAVITTNSRSGPLQLVDGPHLLDQAERIEVDERAGTYRVIGKGRFWRFHEPLDLPLEGPIASGLIDDHLASAAEELRIRWTDGLDIEPAGTPETPDARRVIFLGNVRVTSPELRLEGADRLTALFGGAGTSGIDSIDAEGAINARSVGEPGTILCRTLHIDLETTDDGRTTPRAMHASGAVHVADGEHSLWTNDLYATFIESPVDEVREDSDELFARSRVILDTMHAEDGVQMRLPGGERIFAAAMDASGKNESATLYGNAEPVEVISPEFALTGHDRVLVNRTNGTYQVVGAGRFRTWNDPVDHVDRRVPLDRAEVLNSIATLPLTLNATWTDGALFREGILMAGSAPPPVPAERLSSLELRGSVNVVADPDANEHDEVEAGILTLDFVRGKTDRRELIGMLARQDARLESRTLDPEAPDQPPRIFHIAGQHVFFDQRTTTANVVGPGQLLVRETRVDSEANESAAPAGLPAAFGRGGTTLFRWTERLQMVHVAGERYRIEIEGDVSCIHRDHDDISSLLQCHELVATVDRGAALDREATGDTTLALGGAVELRRIEGHGGVYMQTPGRRVWCDSFDYDLASGVAELAAIPPGRVLMTTDGTARTATAERVLWNMVDDTITIHRGGGS